MSDRATPSGLDPAVEEGMLPEGQRLDSSAMGAEMGAGDAGLADSIDEKSVQSQGNQPIVLQAQGVKRIFKTPAQNLEILRGIDLSVHRGESVALLGVSGAGKSTLIQILGGLDTPSEGSVHILENDFYAGGEKGRARLRNRHIGFVFQYHRLLPEFTALENVMLPQLIGRTDRKQAQSKAMDRLDEVGLKERAHHRPGTLSGGEQQRVAIARALANDPDLLLADEPTGNLDGENARGVFDLLERLSHERQLTTLLVTHNPELAQRLDRRVTLKEGMLIE